LQPDEGIRTMHRSARQAGCATFVLNHYDESLKEGLDYGKSS